MRGVRGPSKSPSVSETQEAGNFDELLHEHCVLNRLIAHECEAFVEAFEERGLSEACKESTLVDLLIRRAAVEKPSCVR